MEVYYVKCKQETNINNLNKWQMYITSLEKRVTYDEISPKKVSTRNAHKNQGQVNTKIGTKCRHLIKKYLSF